MSDIFLPPYFENRPYAAQQFKDIVEWASKNHPFYQKHIPNPASYVPIIQREQILEDNDLLLNGYPQTDSTGGSTGIRVRCSSSPERYKLENEDNLLFRTWMGGPLVRSSIISMAAHEPKEDNFEVTLPIPEQITFLLDRYSKSKAVALLTYPTNLEMLCQYILENDLDFSFMERIICMSEVYEPFMDQLIAQAFPNARAWSNYSCTEVGVIALRCPENPENHHVMGHKLGVEILNDDDEPCEVGEVGRIIVTDFFNRQAPFIRYELGDMCAPAECSCSVTKRPAIKNLVGKVRGALKDRSGRRIMFTDLSIALWKNEGVKQYQIIQNGLEEFLLRYVLIEGFSQQEVEENMAKTVENYFSYKPSISFIREDRIEREVNGKFYASKCNI